MLSFQRKGKQTRGTPFEDASPYWRKPGASRRPIRGNAKRGSSRWRAIFWDVFADFFDSGQRSELGRLYGSGNSMYSGATSSVSHTPLADR